jgi:hypothetical protein
MESQDRKALEQAGVVFGDAEQKKVLVTLPVGWKTAPYVIPESFSIVDDRGRERGRVSEFLVGNYDAWWMFVAFHRFGICEHQTESGRGSVVYRIVDGEKTIFETKPVLRGRLDYREYRQQCRKAYAVAEAKLDELRPGWRDPSAHWND